MFGQELLEKPLAQLEIDAQNDAIKDFSGRIQRLESISKQSEDMFSNYVSLLIK